MIQAPSGGAQMPQLALQQTSPGGHSVGPHGWRGHRSLEQGRSGGRHWPPQAGQQVVLVGHRITAHGLSGVGWQIPWQSAPPAAGSHVSAGSSTQVNPGGQGRPSRPPHGMGALRRRLRRFLRRDLASPAVVTPRGPRNPSAASRARRLTVTEREATLAGTSVRANAVSLLMVCLARDEPCAVPRRSVLTQPIPRTPEQARFAWFAASAQPRHQLRERRRGVVVVSGYVHSRLQFGAGGSAYDGELG